jgi:hypothetical protein
VGVEEEGGGVRGVEGIRLGVRKDTTTLRHRHTSADYLFKHSHMKIPSKYFKKYAPVFLLARFRPSWCHSCLKCVCVCVCVRERANVFTFMYLCACVFACV